MRKIEVQALVEPNSCLSYSFSTSVQITFPGVRLLYEVPLVSTAARYSDDMLKLHEKYFNLIFSSM